MVKVVCNQSVLELVLQETSETTERTFGSGHFQLPFPTSPGDVC